MKKGTRTLLTLAVVAGILILAVRGISLTPAGTSPMPSHSFTMNMNGITWKCTTAGNTIINCR